MAQNALQREWGNFPFANWNGICWGLLLQLVQLIKIHFLPHLDSFIWEQKFEKNFFKKSPIQPPNGALLIFKLPFSNGSYRNGVFRALWAECPFPINSFLDNVLDRFLDNELLSLISLFVVAIFKILSSNFCKIK